MSIPFSHSFPNAVLKSHISTSFIELEHELQDQVIDATVEYVGTDDSIPPEVMVTVRQCNHTIEVLRKLRSSLMSSNVNPSVDVSNYTRRVTFS